MNISISNAIEQLCPGARWTIYNNNYDSLIWYDTIQIKPTREEIETKINELKEQYPLKLLRQERNRRLADCDFVVIRAYSQQQPVPVEWANYMQQLRDLPTTSIPRLNELGQLDTSSIDWPTPPS